MSLTQWKSATRLNTEAGGTQAAPKVLGLSNGNILVAWEDTSDVAGPGNRTDIVGVLLNPMGFVLRGPFQINNARQIDDERDFEIAATADGGFRIAFVDDETWDGLTQRVFIGTYASSGDETDVDEVPLTGVDPDLSIASDGGAIFVTLRTETGGGSQTYLGYAETEQGSFTFAAPENPFREFTAKALALPNDMFVVVYERDGTADRPLNAIALTVFEVANIARNEEPEVLGISPVSSEVFISGAGAQPRLTLLANGNFVVTYRQINRDQDGNVLSEPVRARIFDPSGAQIGNLISVDFGVDRVDPQVIGLRDGGFFIAWDNNVLGHIEGRRFDSAGNEVGSGFVVASGSTALRSPDVSLTYDGRILVTFVDQQGDISLAIVDPRVTSTITSEGTGPITALQSDTTLVGSVESDAFYGVSGNDTITGAAGNDLAYGGVGNDSIEGNDGDDRLNGGIGNDTICGDGDDDTLYGQGGHDSLSGGADNDQLFGGTGDDLIDAGDGSDLVLGQAGADWVEGGLGDDTLRGGSGDDVLYGGEDDDTLEGQGNNDALFGGEGNDFLRGAAGRDSLFGGAGNDEIFGGTAGDVLDGGSGNDTLNAGDQADRIVYALGYGADEIRGFGDDQDTLALDLALFDPNIYPGGPIIQNILDDYADEFSGGVNFDFGNGDTLRVTSINEIQLLNDIVFF